MDENSNDAPRKLSEAEIDVQIDHEIARIDGINGSAGHHLDDPYLRGLLRQLIAGEITGEEYDRLGMEHLRKQNAK
jgi:hypothetical protein